MRVGPGSIIAGKYRIERPLAQGGMGSVWVARHVHLGTRLAIKLMSPSVGHSASIRGRFEREARAAASLQSPHVVHVQDYGVDRDTPYLVMELLEGEDLGTRLRRVGKMSIEQVAHILFQIGKALRRAHNAGIVHRDLKPGNIFLSRIDEEEIVKILDFGIAKDKAASLAGEMTKTGEFLGSPQYMSPEQVRCERDIDERSDLWSLGVIVFRLLTGELPFAADAASAVLAKIVVGPIPKPSSHVPGLGPEVDTFMATALARDRNERFQTIHEMVHAFSALLDDADLIPASARSPLTSGNWPAVTPSARLPSGKRGAVVVTPLNAAAQMPAAPQVNERISAPGIGLDLRDGAVQQKRAPREMTTAPARHHAVSGPRPAPRPPYPPPRPRPSLAATAPDAPTALAPSRLAAAVSFPTMTEIASTLDTSQSGARRSTAWRGVLAAVLALVGACLMLVVILSSPKVVPPEGDEGSVAAASPSADTSDTSDAGTDGMSAREAEAAPPEPSAVRGSASADAGPVPIPSPLVKPPPPSPTGRAPEAPRPKKKNPWGI